MTLRDKLFRWRDPYDLAGTEDLFAAAMCPAVGEMEYGEEDRLIPRADSRPPAARITGGSWP